MKKTANKILCVLLSAVMLFTLLPAFAGFPAFADDVSVVAEGFCGGEGDGTNLSWTLNDRGMLTIRGAGAMADFSFNTSPWHEWQSEVKRVILYDDITNIGDCAFHNCSGLSSVTMPGNAASIGDHAFAECYSLTGIAIPGSVRNIGGHAFFHCKSMTDVTMADGVTDIGDYAFSNCDSLSGVTIPGSVRNIGGHAFYNCRWMTDVTMADGVTEIGDYAFAGCSSLTNVTIPESVTSIGDYAFSNCSLITGVTIPGSVTGIGQCAFYACFSLEAFSVDENNLYYSSDGYGCLYNKNRTVFIQCPRNNLCAEYTVPYGVTDICDYAFSSCSSLTGVTLPDTVTSIGDHAFFSCALLTDVTVPDSVTSIGDYAFANCSSLTGVTIPEGVESIGERMFAGCSSLTNVTIPESVTSIGYEAFGGCSSLTGVTIPEGVTSIGDWAFGDCYSLTGVTLPDSVTSIGESAFYMCSSLTGVTLPEGIASISDGTFYSCSSLAGVTLPESVASIGSYAFGGCSSFTSVTIPVGVTRIGQRAFEHCASLREVYIPRSMTQIWNDTFNYCSALGDVYYEGTETEWNAIEVAVNPMTDGGVENALETATIHYDVHYFHTPGKAVTENEIPATCTADGGYDEVVYCTQCPAEISRTHVTLNALGHSFTSEITTPPTCTEAGVRTYTCERCDETYTEEEPALGHGTLGYDVSGAPSTCTVRGYSMTICIACGEITDYQEYELDPTFHNWSRWAVVTPATYLTEGLEQRTCCWCGGAETRPIPVLVPQQKIEDPDTGIELHLQNGVLPENTVFEVDEEFDGTYFRLLNREVGNVSSTLYNITPVADGVNVQPDGWVLVRLPIPAGYNPDMHCVYYISTETGTTERMDCYIEDGYICFQTTHFSVYAIVDASSPAEAPTENPTDDGSAPLSFFARIAAFFRSIAAWFRNLFNK